jgi:hypothetical protein
MEMKRVHLKENISPGIYESNLSMSLLSALIKRNMAKVLETGNESLESRFSQDARKTFFNLDGQMRALVDGKHLCTLIFTHEPNATEKIEHVLFRKVQNVVRICASWVL